jgi:transcriptional regulator with XRE-family HTH domain
MSRIKFKKGLQSKLLASYFESSELSRLEIARNIGVSQRTLADWKREKYTMSQEGLAKLVKLAGKSLKIPKYTILSDYWNIKRAAREGGKVVAEKYGGPGTPSGRKKGGKNSQKKRRLFPELYSNCNLRKAIAIPRESSELAEFIGIFLGDGGISNPSQITISFNRGNGRGYSKKVIKLIENLFGITPAVYMLSSSASKNVIRLVVSSANLIEFLEKNKIKRGSKVKNQVDVPSWIKNNPEYSKSCLRGLVDTDGGVYYHRHSSNGCASFNVGLCFTNKSKPLVDFVDNILTHMKFHPKRSWSGDNIFLYRESEVLRYEKEVGFTNFYQKKRLKST